MTTTIAEYSKTDAALSDLATRYKDVIFQVTTKDGMEDAKKSRAEIRTYRVDLEKLRKEIKAPALLKCQQIDSEAKRITTELESLENPIDAQIKAEETRKEEEKNAAARAEQARVMAEQQEIKDAEEAKMAADRAEIERQKVEIEAAKKLLRDQIEAQERAARMRIEEEERKARMEREEADRQARIAREAEEAKAKAIRDEEDARIKAERDKLESERRAAEEVARKEREAEEAKQREILRKQAKLADATELLKMFIAQYGDLPEFKFVSDTIRKYLK